MYLVTCNYGTQQWCWRLKEALSWLPACGPRAEVRSIWGRVVARRVQEATQ